jgi:hypothetical protein
MATTGSSRLGGEITTRISGAAAPTVKVHGPEEIATRGRLKSPPEAGEFAT